MSTRRRHHRQSASGSVAPVLGRIAAGLALALGIGLAITYRDTIDPQVIRDVVDSLGFWATGGFIAIYVVAALFFVPGSALTLAAGAVFGPFEGTLYSLVGATLGASVAFLVARYIAGRWVRRRISGRLERLIEGVEADGWKAVAFTRLVPVFPYNLLNYAFGLTRIRLGHFALTSFVTMAPGAAAYAYLGHAGHQLAAGTEDAIRTALFGLGAVAVLVLVSTLLKRHLRGRPSVMEPDALRGLLADSSHAVGVLDVRSEAEFRGPGGHIEGARNIPVGELEARLEELSDWRRVPVVAVCRTDRRSAAAARVLSRAGFENVSVLAGGMDAWRAMRLSEPA